VRQDLLERARRARRLRLGAALVLVAVGLGLALACGRGDSREPSRPVVPISTRFTPAQTIALGSRPGGPHEPEYLVQATADELLSIEKGTQDLWALPLTSGRRPRRVGPLRGRGRTRIVGAAGRNGTLAMLDLTGTLWLYRAGEARPFSQSRVSVPRGTRAVALLATADSSWLIVEERSSMDGATRTARDSLLVVAVAPGGVVRGDWGFERAGPARPDAFLADFVAASSYGDTVVLTAADPARITMWLNADSASRRQVLLADVPRRPMSASDRAELATAANSVNVSLVRGAALPEFYPPVAGARPDGQAWFVVAGTGRNSFALDYYCHGRFAGTLLEHAAVTRISLLERGVAVVRDDMSRGGLSVEFYPYSVFERSCP
jgi:hypothetical protein